MDFSKTVLAAAASQDPANWFVVVMGMVTVLLGLICIIVLCWLMGVICTRFGGEESASAAAPQPAAAPVAVAPSATIPNRGELIAAVTAAIAEELGTDVSALRVTSFRRVDGNAAGCADPARGELTAAVSAALAEELGTDVSAIRIHSLNKIG